MDGTVTQGPGIRRIRRSAQRDYTRLAGRGSVAAAFIVVKEENLIFNDGATDASGERVPDQILSPNSGMVVKPVICCESLAPVELECGTVERISACLRTQIDLRSGRSALVGITVGVVTRNSSSASEFRRRTGPVVMLPRSLSI